MAKLAICKIWSFGNWTLILGIGRKFEEGDEHWELYEVLTMEEYVGDPNYIQELVDQYAKFRGNEVLFPSIGKTVPIHKLATHDFDVSALPPVEITVDELKLVKAELFAEGWSGFDWEKWAK